MIDAQTLTTMFGGIGVGVAAIYYILTLRNSQKTQELTLKAQQQSVETRQSQILMSIYQNMSTPEYQKAWYEIVMVWKWKDYDDFMNKYGPFKNNDANAKRASIGMNIEGIGVLVKRGLIDVRMVDDMMSIYIIGYWEKFESVIREWRRIYDVPTSHEHAEYLYNEVKRIYKEEHPEVGTSLQVPSVK